MNRWCVAIAVLIAAWGTSCPESAGQTPEKEAATSALREVFGAMDLGDTEGLENLVTKNVEVFDSIYPLRLDGWTGLKEYLEDLQGYVRDLKTSIRQPSVRLFGSVAVVNFYYTQDYVLITVVPGEGSETEEGPSAGRERTSETGRGTAALLKSGNTWKILALHLSQLPTPLF